MKSFDEMLFGIAAVDTGLVTADQLAECEGVIREVGETGHRVALDKLLVDRGFLDAGQAAEVQAACRELERDAEVITGRVVVEETLITIAEVEAALVEARQREGGSVIDALRERQVLTSAEASAIKRKAIARVAQQAAADAAAPADGPAAEPSADEREASSVDDSSGELRVDPLPMSSSGIEAISNVELDATGQAKLEAGTQFGTYLLEQEIARGGMGIIFKARNLNLERVVAIKTLSHAFNANPKLVRRFITEAKALARLMHPNIVQVFNVGKVHQTYFLEMEFVDGEDLHALIVREAPLPLEDSVALMLQVIKALEAAQEKGIVHRDVKPENILINEEGVAKLTDFGIVKMAESSGVSSAPAEAEDQPTATRHGEVIGTPYYISPEQARGSSEVDFRADIYSLGATFFRCLTGRPPFTGRSALDVIAKHLHQPLIPYEQLWLDGVSREAYDVAATMLEKNPYDRYQSWAEVYEAVDALTRIGGCPSCGNPGMLPEHIICIDCGYNRKSGQHLQTKFGKPPTVTRTKPLSSKVTGRGIKRRPRGRSGGGTGGQRTGGSSSSSGRSSGRSVAKRRRRRRR